MKNTKPQLSVAPEVWQQVDAYAANSGLKTANTLMSAAAVEFAKAAAKGLNVWHVLGRISADDEHSAPLPDNKKRLPNAGTLEIAR